MNKLFDEWKKSVGEKPIYYKMPSQTESQAIERMMRCGIEARMFQPETEDELYQIAKVTLIQDRIKHG